jgi:LPS-assembly lipoprotein
MGGNGPSAPCSHARRRLAAALLALPAVAMLGGCGFRLRGAVDIPPGLSPVLVRGGGLVGRSIEARLIASGVRTTTVPTDAGLVIDILSEERSSRVVAVDSGGKALAFMLTYRVRFAVLDAVGAPLIEPQRLTLDRTFDDNPDAAVLGKEQEADIIYSDMADDAADQVIFRLRAALANRPAAG